MLDFGFLKNRMSDGVNGPFFKHGIRYCLCDTGTEPREPELLITLDPMCLYSNPIPKKHG